MEEIKLEFNQINVLLRIAVGMLTITVGIWLLYGDTSGLDVFPKLADPALKEFAGYLLVILMTIGVAFLFKCLFTRHPGIIIDEEGILNKTSIIPKRKIYWETIENIEVTTLKFFFIEMPVIKITPKKPGEKVNLISAGLLNISLDKLFNIIRDKFDKTTANTG